MTLPSTPPRKISERAELRTIATRRSRVIRTLVLFVFATIVMLIISLLNRDLQAVQSGERWAKFWAQEFQKLHDDGRPLPLQLPLPPNETDALRDRYVYNVMYDVTLRNRGRAAVCYPAVRLDLYLRADGRHVLMFDGKRFEVVWMTEPEFRESAERLGIHVPSP